MEISRADTYLLTYLITCLLTPWSTFLLEKQTDFHLDKKFPSFHRARRIIAAVTSARHLSLSWASSNQSIPSHPTSWRSILILSSHLRLVSRTDIIIIMFIFLFLPPRRWHLEWPKRVDIPYVINLYCRTVHVATLVIQSNSCTIHTLKHTHFNI